MKHTSHLTRSGFIAGVLLAAIAVAQSPVDGKGRDGNKAAAKAEPLTVKVTPIFALAGNSVRATLKVAPHSENRLLRIVVDSEDYYQSTDVELDGEDAAVTHYVPMKSLPAGRYELIAVVIGTQGERARIDQKFRLLSLSEASTDKQWQRRR